jgi:hypothetical protein
MILDEMKNEAGKNYIKAREDYIYLLGIFREHMEMRNYSLLLRVLYPELSPNKQLTSSLANLDKPETQDDAEKQIKEASKAIEKFISESRKFAGTQVSMPSHHDMPVKLLSVVKSALDDSKTHVEKYGKNLTMLNSQVTCRRNRIAAALAYLTRCAYQDFRGLDGELRQFRGDINRTIYYNDVLKGKKEISKEDRGRLEKYSNSEMRRLKIVNALLGRDSDRAVSLLENRADTPS